MKMSMNRSLSSFMLFSRLNSSCWGGGERDNGINTADMTNVSQRLEVVGKRESKDLRCNVGTDSVLYETRPEC